MEIDHPTEPGVPWIQHLSTFGHMGFAMPSCITRVDLTPRWDSFHPANMLNWPRGTAALRTIEPEKLTARLDRIRGHRHKAVFSTCQWHTLRVLGHSMTPRFSLNSEI